MAINAGRRAYIKRRHTKLKGWEEWDILFDRLLTVGDVLQIPKKLDAKVHLCFIPLHYL